MGTDCDILEVAAGPLTGDIGGEGETAPVLVTGPAQVSGDVTITTTGNVGFQGTGGFTGTDGDPADTLTINAGTVTIEGPITNLANVTINATNIIINTPLGTEANPLTQVTLNGPVTLNYDIWVSGTDPCWINITDYMTVNGDRVLTAGDCTIDIAGAGPGGLASLTLTAAGDTTLNNNIIGLGGFTTDGGGTTHVYADTISIGAFVTTIYAEDWVLHEDLTISDEGSGIFFEGTIDSAPWVDVTAPFEPEPDPDPEAYKLTVVVNPDGVVEFNGVVGGSTDPDLLPPQALTVRQGGIITDRLELTVGPTGVITIGADITTIGDQNYEASVLIKPDLSEVTSIQLESTAGKINVTDGLTAMPNIDLIIKAVGTSLTGAWAFSGTGSLTSNTSGQQLLIGGSLTTDSGAVSISANEQESKTAGNFHGIELSGFSITTGSGSITLAGTGGSTSGDGLQLGSSIASTSGAIDLTGTGNVDGATGVDVGAGVVVSTTGLFSLDGNATDQGSSYGYHVADTASLNPGGAGADTISGANNNVLRLDSSKTGGSLTFTGSIDTDFFRLNGASVAVTLNHSMVWRDAGDAAADDDPAFWTTGVVTANGDIFLSKPLDLSRANSLVLRADMYGSSFADGVELRLPEVVLDGSRPEPAEGFFPIIIYAGGDPDGVTPYPYGTVTFEGEVTGAAENFILRGNVSLQDDVTLTDTPLDVTGPTTIDRQLGGEETAIAPIVINTGTGTITLQQVSGTVVPFGSEALLNSLTLTAAGTTSLDGTVSVLESLTTDGGGETWINTNSIVIGGLLTATTEFKDLVKLEQDVVIQDLGSSGIFFRAGIDGAFDLTLNASGEPSGSQPGPHVNIAGPVGATQADWLTSLTIRNGDMVLGGVINTSGNQSYEGRSLSLSAPTALNLTGSDADPATIYIANGGPLSESLTISADALQDLPDFAFAGAANFSLTIRSTISLLGSTFTSDTGDITMVGTSSDGPGIDLTDTIVSTTSGAITLTGVGGTAVEGGAEGVLITGTSRVRSTEATTKAGTITITGTGGTGIPGYGVHLRRGLDTTESLVESSTGNIMIDGTGGGSETSGHAGVYITGGVESTGTSQATAASITIIGAANREDGGAGVFVSGGLVDAKAGSLTVTGTTEANVGVGFDGDATVSTTSGALTVTGNCAPGSPSSTGVYSWSGFPQATTTGDVVVTGSDDCNNGIRWQQLLTIEKTGGSYTLVGGFSTSAGLTALTSGSNQYDVVLRGGGNIHGPVALDPQGEVTFEGTSAHNISFHIFGALTVTEASQLTLSGNLTAHDNDATITPKIEAFGQSASLSANGGVLRTLSTIDTVPDADPVPDFTVSGDSGFIDGVVGGIRPPRHFTTSPGVGAFTLKANITATEDISLGTTLLANSIVVTSLEDNGNFTLSGELNDDGATTPSSLTINVAGITKLENPIGNNAAIDSLVTDLDGTTRLASSIRTAGSMTFNDPAEVVSLDGPVVLTDIGSGAGIVFANTVNEGGVENFPGSLTVIAAADRQAISFTGTVGSNEPLLENLTIETPFTLTQDVTMNAKDIVFGVPSFIITDNDIEPSPLVIPNSLTVNGDTITNYAELNFASAKTFSATAAVSFDHLGEVNTTGTGTLTIAATGTSPNAMFADGSVLSSEAGAITLTFTADTVVERILASLNGSIASTTGSIDITGTLAGGYSGLEDGGAATVLSLWGPITTGGDTTILGSGGLTSEPSGTIDAVEIGGSISSPTGNIDITGLADTTGSARGVFFEETGSVTTAGTADGMGNVTVTGTVGGAGSFAIGFDLNDDAGTTIDATGSGDVTVTGTIEEGSTGYGIHSWGGFAQGTGTGTVVVTGDGTIEDIRWQNPLTIVKDGGSYTFVGDIEAGAPADGNSFTALASASTEAQPYAVEMAEGGHFNGSAVFGNTGELTLGAAGDNDPLFRFDRNLTITSPSALNLGADLRVDDDSITIDPDITLINHSNMLGYNSTVTLNGTIDEEFGLGLRAATGTLMAEVGGVTPLANLSMDEGEWHLWANIETADDVTVSEIASVILRGDVIITAPTEIEFKGPIDAQSIITTSLTEPDAAPASLTLNCPQYTLFYGTVGGITPPDRIETDADGTTYIGADMTASGGSLLFYDAVSLEADVTLTDQGTGQGILFGKTVQRSADVAGLTLLADAGSQAIHFSGHVGLENRPLTGLTIQSPFDLANDTTMWADSISLENSGSASVLDNSLSLYGETIQNEHTLTFTDGDTDGAGFSAVAGMYFSQVAGSVTTGKGDITIRVNDVEPGNRNEIDGEAALIVDGGIATQSGSITLNGHSGGTPAFGVILAAELSTQGSVSVNGSSAYTGVWLSGQISGADELVSISGSGGAVAAYGFGTGQPLPAGILVSALDVDDALAASIQTDAGDITLTGTTDGVMAVGVGIINYDTINPGEGIVTAAPPSVTATGEATITIDGSGGFFGAWIDGQVGGDLASIDIDGVHANFDADFLDQLDAETLVLGQPSGTLIGHLPYYLYIEIDAQTPLLEWFADVWSSQGTIDIDGGSADIANYVGVSIADGTIRNESGATEIDGTGVLSGAWIGGGVSSDTGHIDVTGTEYLSEATLELLAIVFEATLGDTLLYPTGVQVGIYPFFISENPEELDLSWDLARCHVASDVGDVTVTGSGLAGVLVSLGWTGVGDGTLLIGGSTPALGADAFDAGVGFFFGAAVAASQPFSHAAFTDLLTQSSASFSLGNVFEGHSEGSVVINGSSASGNAGSISSNDAPADIRVAGTGNLTLAATEGEGDDVRHGSIGLAYLFMDNTDGVVSLDGSLQIQTLYTDAGDYDVHIDGYGRIESGVAVIDDSEVSGPIHMLGTGPVVMTTSLASWEEEGGLTFDQGLVVDAPISLSVEGTIIEEWRDSEDNPMEIASPTTLTGDAIIGGGILTISSPVDGGFDLYLWGDGTVSADLGGSTPLASLYVDEGVFDWGANVTTNDGEVTFDYSELALTADLLINAGSGGVTLCMVDDWVPVPQTEDEITPAPDTSLTVNSTGLTTFECAVGETNPLESLTTNALGSTLLWADITTNGSTMIFGDPVVLETDVLLTEQGPGGIEFGDTINSVEEGYYNLTLALEDAEAVAILGGDVGADAESTILETLTVTGGPAQIDNESTIWTTDVQTYEEGILAGTTPYTLRASDLTFGGPVDVTHGPTFAPFRPWHDVVVDDIPTVIVEDTLDEDRFDNVSGEFVLDSDDWGHLTTDTEGHVYLNQLESEGDIYFMTADPLPAPVTVAGGDAIWTPDIDTTWTMTGEEAGGIVAAEWVELLDFVSINGGLTGDANDTLNFSATGWFHFFYAGDGSDTLVAGTSALFEVGGEGWGYAYVGDEQELDFEDFTAAYGSEEDDLFNFIGYEAFFEEGIWGGGSEGDVGDIATFDHSAVDNMFEYVVTDALVNWAADYNQPIAELELVNIDHGFDNDVVQLTVSANTTFNLDGADHNEGDVLIVDGQQDEGATWITGGFGFDNFKPVLFTRFEYANIINVPVDLGVEIVDASADSVEPEDEIVYTLELVNNTPSVVWSEVSFVVPANTMLDPDDEEWYCDADGQAGDTCLFEHQFELIAGAQDEPTSVEVPLIVITPVSAGAETIDLTVAIHHADWDDEEEDPIVDHIPGNNTDSIQTELIAQPELGITIVDSHDPVSDQELLTYTVVVTNYGNQGAVNIDVDVSMPQQGTFNVGGSDDGWSCDAESCSFFREEELVGGEGFFETELAFMMPQYFESHHHELDVTAHVEDDGGNGVDDPFENNTESENTVIDAEPDMVVTVTDGDVRTAVNSSVVYTVDIANVGNQDAVNVLATVSVPTYTTLQSIVANPGWDCTDTLCTNPIGDLDGGATGQYVFTFVTDPTIPAGVEFLFIEATLNDDQSNGEEPTVPNNTAEDSTPFDAEPIMDLAKVANLTDAEPGQDIAYTLTMQNIGDQGATGIVLNEMVPVNTTYNALESTVGWECVDGAVAAGTHCTFSLAGMEALKGRTVIFSVTVDDILDAGQSIVHNEALLEDDGLNSFGNETPTTDTAEVDVDLINQPGLLVGLTHTGEDLPMPEDLIPFDVEWANTGAQGFSGVEMEMIVPTGTIFSVLHSDAWDCGGLTEAGTTCTFDVGVVPSGDRNTVVFAVIADDDLEPGTEILQGVYIHDDSLSASLELESDTAEETVLLNRTPEIADQPENRNATEGQEMSWHLPDDVFSDPDEVRGDTLTVSASSDEPAWVDFDEETFIFSGIPTPDDTGNTTTFEITATDERGLTVSFDLEFIVNNVNNAPEIEADSEVLGTDINEDDIDSDGDLISDLTEELITDADGGASTGIALVYADDTNGIWEFRLTDDGEWTALGTLSESDALVIDAGDEERLRFVPNADYFGPAEGRFVAWDGTDGSVSGDVEVVLGETGGDSAFSANSAMLSIEVLSVNDVPSFIAGEDVSVDEDAGAISVSDWAIDMSTGPENESEQSFAFELTTDNDDLFSVLPAISASGTLTFRTVRNAGGTASVTVVAVDNGGTERGGVDESDGVDFTISVGAVNDGPLFVAPTPSGTIEVNEDTELAFTIAVEDPDGPELILTVDGAPSTAVVDLENGTFTWTPTYLDWGTWEVVLNASDGSLSDERVLEIVVIVADTNDNGIPDVFETENGLDLDGDDADGDGIPNLVEIGDYTDPSDSDDDGEIDAVETDSDNDGVDDEVEAGDDPENPVDSDDDGTPDYQDEDSDDDELLDGEDNCRTVVNVDQADRDGDGEGDLCDNDIDGDGLENEDEKDIGLDPENEDTDGDTIGDGDEVSDASDPEDTDEDDIIDALDPDSDDDGLFDADEAGDDLVDTEPIDTDDDGTPNFRDSDSDDDDVDDVDDNCPLVANTDQIDTDGDGDGDDCDGDSDGDGLSDEEDNCLWVANPDQNDQDEDGEGDDCDDDQDGDGVVNVDDNCPLSPNPNQEDEDLDGIGTECDPITAEAEPPGCNCSAAAGSSSGGVTWLFAAVIGLAAIRRRRNGRVQA